MTISENLARITNEHAEAIRNFQTAITEGGDLDKALSEVTARETEYLTVYEKQFYERFDTVADVLAAHHFTTISHKVEKKDGRTTGILYQDKTVTIDLKKFCEQKGQSVDWYYELQALNKRLTLWCAKSIDVPENEIALIDKSYTMDQLAKEIALGKTPTSNTQIAAHMQRVFDKMGDGIGKVLSKDLAYVQNSYAKRSTKKMLTLQASNHKALMTLLTDVGCRIVTNGHYSIDCKLDEADKVVVPSKPEEDTTTETTETNEAEQA